MCFPSGPLVIRAIWSGYFVAMLWSNVGTEIGLLDLSNSSSVKHNLTLPSALDVVKLSQGIIWSGPKIIIGTSF